MAVTVSRTTRHATNPPDKLVVRHIAVEEPRDGTNQA